MDKDEKFAEYEKGTDNLRLRGQPEFESCFWFCFPVNSGMTVI